MLNIKKGSAHLTASVTNYNTHTKKEWLKNSTNLPHSSRGQNFEVKVLARLFLLEDAGENLFALLC